MNCIKSEAGRIKLLLDIKKLGEDYLLTLTGGKAHAGAVAVGLFDKTSKRASSSVITLPGHREDRIALDGARQVSRATRTTTVFVVGIHFEDISPVEIEWIVSTSEKMLAEFIKKVES
ncbi:MAG: hypothetical protein PHV51_05770 [Methanosarcinaceae archaeon]|nr:hypothetical protein [Methanosarcinaceae archaeon]MDD4497642.1 hypothetical protein [Methanosarcinaceae archaeon]